MTTRKRKPEAMLNDKIQAALFHLDPRRVENSVDPGFPDISYSLGLIESKVLPRLSKTGVVKVPKYRKEQRAWHIRARKHRRVHFVLHVQSDDSYFVFDAAQAAISLGVFWTRADIIEHARLILCPWDKEMFRTWFDTLDPPPGY